MATKQTKLEAVNTIISNIGQSPVNSLDTRNPLVEMAESVLEEVSRVVQAEGWTFNTEFSFPFNRNSSNMIDIPADVLSIDGPPVADNILIIRNNKLYDKYNHTFVFDDDQELDVVWLFDFEDLPEAIKNYVTMRAANVFAGRAVGTTEQVRFGQQEEIMSRAAAMEYETQQGDYSIFSGEDGRNYMRTFRPERTLYRY